MIIRQIKTEILTLKTAKAEFPERFYQLGHCTGYPDDWHDETVDGQTTQARGHYELYKVERDENDNLVTFEAVGYTMVKVYDIPDGLEPR